MNPHQIKINIAAFKNLVLTSDGLIFFISNMEGKKNVTKKLTGAEGEVNNEADRSLAEFGLCF